MVSRARLVVVHFGTYVIMYTVYPAGAKLSARMTVLKTTKDAKLLIVVMLIMGLFLLMCRC